MSVRLSNSLIKQYIDLHNIWKRIFKYILLNAIRFFRFDKQQLVKKSVYYNVLIKVTASERFKVQQSTTILNAEYL